MNDNGTQSVRFVDFFKEPLGWPANEDEILIDINSIPTDDFFQNLDSSALNLEMKIPNLEEGEITFFDLEALFETGLPADLPDTSVNVPGSVTPFPSTSNSNLTILMDNLEGDQTPLRIPSFDEQSEQSNKRRKLTHPSSSPLTQLQHDQQLQASILTLSKPPPDSISDIIMGDTTSNLKAMSSLMVPHALASPLPPQFVISSTVASSTAPGFVSPTGWEYISGDLAPYTTSYPHGSQMPNSSSTVNQEPFPGLSLQAFDHLDRFGHRVNSTSPRLSSPLGFNNESTCNVPQRNYTPILDLQIQPDISHNYNSSSGPPNYSSPILSISRSSRHQPQSNEGHIATGQKLVYKHAPAIPTLIHPAVRDYSSTNSSDTLGQSSLLHPLSSIDIHPFNDNLRISQGSGVSENNINFRSTNDTSGSGFTSETYNGPRPIIPIEIDVDQSVCRRDGPNAVEGTPETGVGTPGCQRRSKSSKKRPKKFYFRPIRPFTTSAPLATYPSPLSSNSPSNSASPAFVDLTDIDSFPQPSDIPTPGNLCTVPIGSVTPYGPGSSGQGRDRYTIEVPFNTIIPTSEAEVIRRVTGVAFSELKQSLFGFGPVSEILEDPDSRPFYDHDRMTVLYVLVKWPFPLGQKETSHKHKIVQSDRPINHFRRVEILCKIARKLYDYIQKEEEIPFDPKKLCILALCQRTDKNWVVEMGFNNSSRV